MKAKILVLIISLPEATERRGRLLRRLQALCVDQVELINAIRGSALGNAERQAVYDEQSVRHYAGRSMTAGELGCALSHQRCYQAFLASDADWALILEDDAELPDDLMMLLDELTKRASSWALDVFNLGPVRKFVFGKSRPVLGYRIVDPVRIWNAHAYLANRSAATAMLIHNTPVRFMADDWATYRELSGLRLAALDPFPCAQAITTLMTGLEQDRQFARKTRLPWGRPMVWHLILRLRRRITEFRQSFGRRIHSH